MAEEGESEPLLPSQSRTAADTSRVLGGGGGFPWLTAAGFAFLTFNSGMAIYRSHDDKGSAAFVVASYLDLVGLFACLRRFERAPLGSVTRSKLKMAVGLLLAVLTSLFSIKVAATFTMPAAVKVLVWLMAVATTISGGFYAFFLHWNPNKGFVLATLRSHLPETAGGGSSASAQQDPRDTAWSRARLIVDSGATGHAVGDILLLEGFVPYRPPLVATLADGSHLRIFGIGRIQRGNFSIPNVSLVEGVQDGLISTPQLDARHGLVSCFGNGVCRIMEADGTEVGGAVLEEDGHYVLRYLEVTASR